MSIDYHRQGDTMVMVKRHFPAISVAKVLEYDFLGINLGVAVAVSGSCGLRRREHRRKRHHENYQILHL